MSSDRFPDRKTRLALQTHTEFVNLRSLSMDELDSTSSDLDLQAVNLELRDASAEGFVRLIVDEGEPAGALIRSLIALADDDEASTSDPLLTVYLQRLGVTLGPGTGTESETASQASALNIEALTRTEIRVLQLLAEGYSNSAMAEKLFVSDSTVRTHLRNINMKLDARSRTQAVAIGRRLGLIP